MNDGKVIWEWVSQAPDGISRVGAYIPGLGHGTLTARDKEVAYKLRPFAKSHAKATGQRTWLREYHFFADHEEA